MWKLLVVRFVCRLLDWHHLPPPSAGDHKRQLLSQCRSDGIFQEQETLGRTSMDSMGSFLHVELMQDTSKESPQKIQRDTT